MVLRENRIIVIMHMKNSEENMIPSSLWSQWGYRAVILECVIMCCNVS